VAPRDWSSICTTIDLLTEYLEKPVIASSHSSPRPVRLWHGLKRGAEKMPAIHVLVDRRGFVLPAPSDALVATLRLMSLTG
jgi:hypothetical protein